MNEAIIYLVVGYMWKKKKKTLSIWGVTSTKLPVPIPKTKASSTCQYMDDYNDEERGVDGVEEAKESEEDEPVVEEKQGPMDLRVQKLITSWTGMSYKEFGDYRKSNYSLRLDNARIKARLEALAQRQQMQVNQHEQNTAYLSGLKCIILVKH